MAASSSSAAASVDITKTDGSSIAANKDGERNTPQVVDLGSQQVTNNDAIEARLAPTIKSNNCNDTIKDEEQQKTQNSPSHSSSSSASTSSTSSEFRSCVDSGLSTRSTFSSIDVNSSGSSSPPSQLDSEIAEISCSAETDNDNVMEEVAASGEEAAGKDTNSREEYTGENKESGANTPLCARPNGERFVPRPRPSSYGHQRRQASGRQYYNYQQQQQQQQHHHRQQQQQQQHRPVRQHLDTYTNQHQTYPSSHQSYQHPAPIQPIDNYYHHHQQPQYYHYNQHQVDLQPPACYLNFLPPPQLPQTYPLTPLYSNGYPVHPTAPTLQMAALPAPHHPAAAAANPYIYGHQLPLPVMQQSHPYHQYYANQTCDQTHEPVPPYHQYQAPPIYYVPASNGPAGGLHASNFARHQNNYSQVETTINWDESCGQRRFSRPTGDYTVRSDKALDSEAEPKTAPLLSDPSEEAQAEDDGDNNGSDTDTNRCASVADNADNHHDDGDGEKEEEEDDDSEQGASGTGSQTPVSASYQDYAPELASASSNDNSDDDGDDNGKLDTETTVSAAPLVAGADECESVVSGGDDNNISEGLETDTMSTRRRSACETDAPEEVAASDVISSVKTQPLPSLDTNPRSSHPKLKCMLARTDFRFPSTLATTTPHCQPQHQVAMMMMMHNPPYNPYANHSQPAGPVTYYPVPPTPLIPNYCFGPPTQTIPQAINYRSQLPAYGLMPNGGAPVFSQYEVHHHHHQQQQVQQVPLTSPYAQQVVYTTTTPSATTNACDARLQRHHSINGDQNKSNLSLYHSQPASNLANLIACSKFKLGYDLIVSLPIEAEPTKTRQAYGMDKVWLDEFEQLFCQFPSHISWTLIEVETNPSIREPPNNIIGYRGRYVVTLTGGNQVDSLEVSTSDPKDQHEEEVIREEDDDSKEGDTETEDSDCDSGAMIDSTSGTSESVSCSNNDPAEATQSGSPINAETTNIESTKGVGETVDAKTSDRKFPTRFKMFIDSAKVRFCCDHCGHGWTSMKGRVVFWYELFELVGDAGEQSLLVGYCAYKLFGQQCDVCKIENRFERPMWYPEEVTKALGNLYNKIGQVYFGFKMPAIDKQRRAGKPKTSHNSSLCQACHDGVCTDRK